MQIHLVGAWSFRAYGQTHMAPFHNFAKMHKNCVLQNCSNNNKWYYLMDIQN
jgi:hypothetical protein